MDTFGTITGEIKGFFSFTTPIQLQLAAIFFLVILEIMFFHRRHLPILSTRTFIGILVFALVFAISDTAIVYVSRLHLPRNWGIRLVSQLRLYAYLNLSLCQYLYITLLQSRRQHIFMKDGFRVFTLYGIGVISIFSVNFIAKNQQQGYLAYDVTNIIINTISFIYAVMTIIETTIFIKKNPDSFFRGKRRYIYWTTTVWIVIVLIQVIQSKTTFSSLGVTAMCFLMYMGLETPGNFIDQDTEAMNAGAMRQILQDYINSKKVFFILNVDIEDYESIEEQFGENIARNLISQISEFVLKSFTYPVFHVAANSITLVIPNNKHVENNFYIDLTIKRIKERLDQAWFVGDNSFYLSSHCDFIVYPDDIQTEISIHELMSMINDWHFYSRDTGFVRQANPDLVKNRKRHNKIIKLVREAIDNDGIEMYYQPIYELKTKKFTNFEALVRLKDNKTYGYISPEEFIPLAEKHGLIMRLSDRIFNQVFDFVASSDLVSKGISHMEVNLSGLQSVDAALPEQMTQLLRKYELNPNIVNLEITESIAITSSFMLKKNMDELKKIGCSFSMDDFGTGYSNLSQMAKVDYELIKIDKSLLWPCFDKNNPVQANAKIILDNMITMILSLGRKIVVEGVETKEQLDYLEKIGVTYIQGYYFSKPLPAADFLRFIEENN
ncbi:MAG: EAL domain-containing protein [Treponema sp.]|nr:EAL domain-containing protein [Treponema sp.]